MKNYLIHLLFAHPQHLAALPCFFCAVLCTIQKNPGHQFPVLGLCQQLSTPLTHLPVDPRTSTVCRPCHLDVLVIQVAYQLHPILRPTGRPSKSPAIPIIVVIIIVIIVIVVILVVVVPRLGFNPIVFVCGGLAQYLLLKGEAQVHVHELCC